jgi:uncharacterized membrane protein
MGKSKSASIVLMGLVSGLLCAMAIAFGKDRDDTRRVQAARATFAAIDFPAAPSTAALDVNSAGDIVGRYPAAGNMESHGFLRNGFGQFTTIDFPHAVFTVAAGINSRGDIVGQYRLQDEELNVRHGFLRTREGTFNTVDPPGSYFTNALGINRRGEIVGRFCTGAVPSPANPACKGNPHHGFLRSGAAFTTIDFHDAISTDAWGINDRGEIVGGYEDKQEPNHKSHVYQFHQGQFKTVDFPGALDTAPGGVKGGINSRGDIVSYYCVSTQCNFDDSQHGFLLTDNEFTTTMDFPATTIGLPGGHVTANFGINARGDIVGTYNDASGKTHGFLLKLDERHEDED